MRNLEYFYAVIKKQRYLMLSLAGILWLISLSLAWQLHIDLSLTSFFPDSPQRIQNMVQAMEMSPFSRLLFINIHISQGTPKELEQAADELLAKLPVNLIQELQGVNLQAQQLLPLVPAYATKESLQKLKTSSQALTKTMEELTQQLSGFWNPGWLAWMKADPIFARQLLLDRIPKLNGFSQTDKQSNYLVSSDGKNLLLTISPVNSMHNTDQAIALLAILDEIKNDFQAQGIQLTIVGGHRHAASNAQTIISDLQNILIISITCFALIYLIFIRSKSALWLLITPIYAASIAWGSLYFFLPQIYGLALGFGASMLGIAEDYAVHTHFALRSQTNSNQVLSYLTRPLLQSMLLNCSAFAVLFLSNIPAIRQMATFAILTLIAGVITALLILPLCPWSGQPSLSSKPAMPRNVAQKALFYSSGVVFSLSCWGVFMIYNIDFNVSPTTLGANMSTLQAEAQYLKQVWGDIQGTTIFIQGTNFKDTKYTLDTVLTELYKINPNYNLMSLANFLPSENDMQNNLQNWKSFVQLNKDLPEKIKALAQQYNFNEALFKPFIAWFTVEAKPFDLTQLQQLGLQQFLDNFYRVHNNQVQMLIVSQEQLAINLLSPVLQEQLTVLESGTLQKELIPSLYSEYKTLGIMLILCFGLLYFCFRDLTQTFIAILPAISALIGVLTWFYVSKQSLTLGAVASLPLVLGLAVDHGIMFTHDLKSGLETHVKRAIIVSSLTAITSMGVLALATHPVLHSIGIVILLGLSIELPISLWILPLFFTSTSHKGI